MLQWLKKLWKGSAREGDGDLPYGSVPDPGLSNHNIFRQWIGIYQMLDRASRERGGVASERPADERMLYIARGLMRYNPYAQGFIGSLRRHVLGANGLVHHAVGPSAKAVQSWLDKWKKETDWWQREREMYERVHVEGEAIPRFFVSEGCVELRMIEPEWVVAPEGTEEWTFGFYNEPDDVETVTALHALYGRGRSEVIEWDEWYHIKSALSYRADKRGRSDFLSVAPLLDDSYKTWRNFARSEAVRQAIIYFAEQAPGVTAEDLEQAIATESDYSPPASDGKRLPGTQLVDSAGVEYLANGTKLAAVPAAENIQGTMTGVNAALLAVGRPYNMPLVLISGDMSANNTLDFGDESPFGTAVGDEQNWYCRHVRNVLMRALEFASEDSEVLSDALYDGTDILVSSERKPARDAEKNTQRAKILADDGVISNRERATMEGVDYDEQQRQKLKEQAGVDPVDNAGVALNGAQISSLLEIADRVAQKQYPGEAGIQMIRSAFPTLPPETIEKIVGSLLKAQPAQPQTVGEEATQLVTVHRKGKTFTEKRKKATHFDTVPRNLLDRAKRITAAVHQKAAELAVRLTPAAMKLGTALGVLLDTPDDMKKFGYNPTTSSGTAATGHDPVKAALADAFGVGVSGHIVASVAANVLSRVFTAAKRKLRGGAEAASDPYQELAEYIEAVYDMVFDHLGLEGKRPKAADIADNLRRLLRQSAGEEAGLAEKDVTFHRGGTTFTEKRMVRTAETDTLHSKAARADVLGHDDHLERAVLYDGKGNKLAATVGDEDSVPFPKTDALKDPDADLHQHHNHPYETPPSMNDVLSLGNYPGLKSLTVHTESGEHRVSKAAGADMSNFNDTVVEVYKKELDAAYQKLKAAKKLRDVAQADHEYAAAAAKALSQLEERGLIKYTIVHHGVEGKESAGEGLVEKDVTVHRDGKTFKQKRMVRAGSPTVHGAHELVGKRAGSDKTALQKFAELAPTADAREAVLDAEYNVPKGDSARDYEPVERRVYTAERLAAAWRDTLERGDKESAAYLEEVMGHFNMELHGPAAGEEVDFDGRYYDSDDSILSGPARVVRPAVVVHTPEGKHIAVKGKAAKVARD